MKQALAAKSAWVFDLDNTLYPAHLTIYDAIGTRMTDFVARATGLPLPEALALQEQYFHDYGASVVGLMRHHAIDRDAFMDFVHDVPLDEIGPAPELAALLEALPTRRFVFTNGAHAYARRILARLGITHLFEQVIALDDVDFVPKPQQRAFELMTALARIDPSRAVMVEDHARNLEPAAAMGFQTVLVRDPAGPPDAYAHEPYVHHRAEDVKAVLRTVLAN